MRSAGASEALLSSVLVLNRLYLAVHVVGVDYFRQITAEEAEGSADADDVDGQVKPVEHQHARRQGLGCTRIPHETVSLDSLDRPAARGSRSSAATALPAGVLAPSTRPSTRPPWKADE